ncbi:unnamed protein product, partial [Ascophyllum nodosum]
YDAPPPPPPADRASFTTATRRRPSLPAARQPPPHAMPLLGPPCVKTDAYQRLLPPDTKKPIKAFASQVEETLKILHIAPRTLRLAVELATNGCGLDPRFAQDILRLRDL